LTTKESRICVFGSRELNIPQCRDEIYNFISSTPLDAIIVEGEAYGADTIARQASEFYRRNFESYPPNYYKYGRYKAPKERNKVMVDISSSGFGVWNGSSGGTTHTYLLFKSQNKDVKLVKIDKK
jgi:hypothetical protein